MPDIIEDDASHPRHVKRWVAWAGLTMLAAVIASCGDRLVGRLFEAMDDAPPPPQPTFRVLVVPGAAPAAPAAAPVREDVPPFARIADVPPRPAIAAPEPDLVAIPAEPVGPAGEAGLIAAMRAGTLRPAGPSDIADWVARHRAKGGNANAEALGSSMRAAYVVTGELVIPAGLNGAHAVTFIVPRGVPYPAGDPGHSLVLDVDSGACVGFICRTFKE